MDGLLINTASCSVGGWLLLGGVAYLVYMLFAQRKKRPETADSAGAEREPPRVSPEARRDFQAPRPVRPDAPYQGKRLLLAEHSTIMRQIVRMLLEPEGFSTVLADNAELFLTLAEKLGPDLVVIDSALPGLGQISLAGRFGSVPILVLASPDSDAAQVQRLQARLVLQKPFESQALLDAVAQVMGGAPEVQETAGSAPEAAAPICPHCGLPVEVTAAVCERCGAAHHPECFKLLDGCGKCGG